MIVTVNHRYKEWFLIELINLGRGVNHIFPPCVFSLWSRLKICQHFISLFLKRAGPLQVIYFLIYLSIYLSICLCIYNIQSDRKINPLLSCSVSWGCRIHRLLLCRGVRPPPRTKECPVYDTKQSDGEVPVMLELCGMRSTL